ncbi:ABC-type transporter, permease protein [Desulforapulum autotrophicum HRM2]|uniref:ABC-type transporter, permease protein n=1 Tax=Desulforapulum autotrophicum (strain ATCC 43914 / DSM 3382 / VKM B-1955 / HRM2) TaxID=177437 RepID=C0QJU0_DESAH|nr:ABC transporter permease [Desulforapulum autotrophicum]ACN13943.1 ABC-type transporter, permease protein [Desulforapulum autotrophicum HRM2]
MKQQRSTGLIPGLALADLKHEWILSLCLFLAVAAVVGPLLLLFGLKNGTMETLRSRLLQDPRNREIRPMVSRSFTPQWLNTLQNDPKVSFLVPTTRSISASVELKFHTDKLVLEALPSAQGDPLLEENQAVPPGERQCVLSDEAARKLGAGAGDEIELWVKRLKGSRIETGSTRLTVSGVLDPRGTSRDVVYFPLGLLEDIEGFKDGQAVPDMGWEGSVPLAQPVFDGVVLGLDTPMDPVLKVRLTSGTGLSRLEELEEDQQMSRLGYQVKNKTYVYLITTTRAQGEDVLTAVTLRLRGRNALVLPWVEPMEIELAQDLKLPVLALPQADGLDTPWGKDLPMGPAWRQIILPKEIHLKPGSRLTCPGKSSLSLKVQPVDGVFSKGRHGLVPPQLAGILNLSLRREIDWLPEKDLFILKRRGYAAFRMYAKTLEQVEPLKLELEAQGIPVHTEAARIRDLRELDRHLGMIFWLIALGGVLGGSGSLTASLYASVERKRRDLGVLALIGFGRGGLLCFPLCQALFLSLGGLGLAFGFYWGMAGLINQLFSTQLAAGERFCQLDYVHLIYAASGVILLGQTAAALAAWRVITIDPAEALRDE